MKHLLGLLLIAFMVGDCIMLKGGVFKGSYWRIIEINADGTFDIKDRDWTIRDVRGSYLYPADDNKCVEKAPAVKPSLKNSPIDWNRKMR